MKTYPKEWIEVIATRLAYLLESAGVEKSFTSPSNFAYCCVNDLDQLGALKEIPKPREWWFCDNCGHVEKIMGEGVGFPCCKGKRAVKMREVIE